VYHARFLHRPRASTRPPVIGVTVTAKSEPFTADIGDIRNRLEEQEQVRARGFIRRHFMPTPDPRGANYCVLHYLGPDGRGDIRPAITTIIGLSTCAACTSDVAVQIDKNGLSAREILAMATEGTWFE
jgi:hypothetical protein